MLMHADLKKGTEKIKCLDPFLQMTVAQTAEQLPKLLARNHSIFSLENLILPSIAQESGKFPLKWLVSISI